MITRRAIAASFVVAALTGCGDDKAPPVSTTTTAAARTTPRATSPASTAASVSGKLQRAETCRRFQTISADFRMSDEQSFAAFSMLAQQTADRTLAAAIQRVADAYARHAESISSAEVQALCR